MQQTCQKRIEDGGCKSEGHVAETCTGNDPKGM